jgi:MFS family permease
MAAEPGHGFWRPLLWLSPGQLISWGTLYYGIAFLALPIHQDTGWRLGSLFAAYATGILVSALAAPLVGRAMARFGPRPVLSGGSLLAALALMVIAWSPNLPVFWFGWVLAGAAMAATLYDAAFSALRVLTGQQFRKAVSLLAIVGGFASTWVWPVSYWLEAWTDWRTVFLIFALLHLAIALPCHLALPRGHGHRQARGEKPGTGGWASIPRSPLLWLLAGCFAAASLLSSAVSAQVGVILFELGIGTGLALLAASLIGPMQVFGRVLDLYMHKRYSVIVLGYVTLILPPLAVVALLLAPHWGPLVLLFALLYGTAHGLTTILKAMAPTLIPGVHSYAELNGWITAPTQMARAAGPLILALILEGVGVGGALIWMLVAGLAALALFGVAARRSRI